MEFNKTSLFKAAVKLNYLTCKGLRNFEKNYKHTLGVEMTKLSLELVSSFKKVYRAEGLDKLKLLNEWRDTIYLYDVLYDTCDKLHCLPKFEENIEVIIASCENQIDRWISSISQNLLSTSE